MVSLTAEVLQFDPLPAVRLDVAVGQSTSWRVTGSGGGMEWLAGEGRGPAVLADPWAPLGVPITYRMTAGAGTWEAGPVYRSYEGRSAVTDLAGRSAVDFLWFKGAGDPWSIEPRATFAEPWGSAYGVGRYAPVAGAGGGRAVARTVEPHTSAMTALLRRNRPVILHHSHGRCEIAGCDIDAVRTVAFTDIATDLTGREDRMQREWTLTYRHERRPHGYLAPVVTVADVLAQWDTTAAMLTDITTGTELVRGDWRVW